MHCTSKALLTAAFGPVLRRATTTTPSFLLPAFAAVLPSSSPTASFSTTPIHHRARKARKDGNLNRGVSALRHTGFGKHQKIVFDKHVPLPKPVLDPKQRSTVAVDEHHPLWEFFTEKRTALSTPDELHAHGRGWTVQELRRKDWDDLHKLWWVCVKERNRIATFLVMRSKVGSMYGDFEANGRNDEVRITMRNIKIVLTERWYAWENARVVAMEDHEVNLYADPEKGEQGYTPGEAPEMISESPFDEVDAGSSTQATMQTPTEPLPPPPSSERSASEARV